MWRKEISISYPMRIITDNLAKSYQDMGTTSIIKQGMPANFKHINMNPTVNETPDNTNRMEFKSATKMLKVTYPGVYLGK